MVTKKRVLKSVSVLWGSALLAAAIAFATQSIIARNLPSEQFGMFASALAFVNILIPLVGFGVPQFWLKVFGEEGIDGLRWVKSSLNLIFICAFIAILALVVWVMIHGETTVRVKWLYISLAFFMIGQASTELAISKLQLEERYFLISFFQILPHAARLIGTVGFIYFLALSSMLGVIAAYICSAVFVVVINIWQLSKIRNGKLKLAGHGVKINPVGENTNNFSMAAGVKDVALEAYPFGLAGAFHLIYFQGSIIFLGILSGKEHAAMYNVAYLTMSAVYIFPNIVYQKFLLPKIHRWANRDYDMFYKSFRVGSFYMALLGMTACVSIFIISPILIPIVFGKQYSDAIWILQVLSLCAPIRFLSTSVGSLLVTKGNMKRKVKYMGGVALISLLANFILVPIISIHGALISTLVSEISLLCIYYLAAKKYVLDDVGRVGI